ncbi:transcriptional regulator [Streptomyces qinzhouensis]|uniref:Transcriptional regulator n=1 Tax=Streptomyces qinzhouensis TaxID=2599401 RepID=A0A5B8JCV9_9ACTN|nr:transcriptional regulator [Streptomyces qinzhouensis]
MAVALAESLLLVGRVELLGRHDPEAARAVLREARTTAAGAGDPLLEAAALGLLALVPADGWAEAAAESFTAARTLLGEAGARAAGTLDWLEAIEAERATRDGEHEKAIRLISRVEGARVRADDRPFPPWLDWCTTARIGILKGRIQLSAGLVAQSRRTLLYAMATVRPDDHGQRSLIYAGLAAVESADGQAYESCGYACRALEHIEAGGDVMGVRAGLAEYLHDSCVEDLYESLAFFPAESPPAADITEVTRRGTGAGRAPGIR